ncbi:Sap30p KNAG_0J00400 [Huiozyma naganishii CBS 8797]|uniref:Histone deacetylase complex subunit SAP30 Sin3 binding domain-containing protein n=1 Tax=Huiozyma naganishii (strain ATCC MYA-139 / BCRC 22969 / CBS 8797 / KCTC 17520 / NBRC 10181 / NCYC 3082 / Yp74L-3) TaxID=1071383 RepID=J7RQP6_HUIN7|nr:hypothetical protein KNAG_0J00400 [Kazachstania naganishii CBS 8797]CCK72123.1 hypothetical protein KNAG_0J00400 [Kazachstania naganishii CBS 8797]
MARHSNSESESRATGPSKQQRGGNSNGPANTPANASANTNGNGANKLTSAQQQYLRDLVRTHITNNHPRLAQGNNGPGQPLDFERYSDEFLRKYRDTFELDVADNLTMAGYLLGSPLGEKTFSYKRDKADPRGPRVQKAVLASACQRHFTAYQAKEQDLISHFIYKVKNQNKKFKMEFKK